MDETDPLEANASRFALFADLYDAVRPTPPDEAAAVLTAYAGGERPRTVVDLGCGSGLSTRWAADWADRVVGIEPGPAMRAIAIRHAPPNVEVRAGWSHRTGLAPACADLVLAVQALHWMEPDATHAEARRLLRPGGVFAALDCDWPPTSGDVEADRAWAECRKGVAEFEKRLALGMTGSDLSAPVTLDDPELSGHWAGDTHGSRTLARGVKSWSKDGHLTRMVESGVYSWCHEVVLHRSEPSDAARFVDLLRSQGDYQTLRREGLDDETLGLARVERRAERAWRGGVRSLLFCYRVRIGVVA